MAFLYEKLTKKGLLNIQTDSEEEEDEIEQEESENRQNANEKINENTNPVSKGRVALRGNALANLLAAGSDDDEDEDSNGKIIDSMSSHAKLAKNNSGKPKSGIYALKLNQAKKDIRENQNKLNLIEDELIKEQEKLVEERQKMHQKSYENSKETTDSSVQNTSKDNDDSTSDDSISLGKAGFKKKMDLNKVKAKNDRDDSPPPPPPSLTIKKSTRSNKISKQLQELEEAKFRSDAKKLIRHDHNLSSISFNECDDLDQIMTVKVSLKTGLKKFEINENEKFLTIFEKLAEIENTQIENLVLTLGDRIIQFDDTPAGIKLRIFDIIDCGKTASVVQERIKIIEGEEKISVSANRVIIMLQTQEGRKSRVKFLIAKDEPFENLLRKYLEKNKLDDFHNYIMEFDGDKVDLAETPNDLDLEGDEVFDVKKCTKSTMQSVNENKKKYDFDDDILTV